MPRRTIQKDDLPHIQALYEAGISSDEIAAQYGCDRTTIYYWLNKLGCARSNAEAKRKYHVNHEVFASVSTEAVAYWLGFLFADGCIYRKNDGGNPRLSLALAEADKDHLHKFNAFMSSTPSELF